MFTFSKFANGRYVNDEWVSGYIGQANDVLRGKVSKLTDYAPDSISGQDEIKAVLNKARNILRCSSHGGR